MNLLKKFFKGECSIAGIFWIFWVGTLLVIGIASYILIDKNNQITSDFISIAIGINLVEIAISILALIGLYSTITKTHSTWGTLAFIIVAFGVLYDLNSIIQLHELYDCYL
ncbi:hypothetical protein GY03_18235 [Proteus vulgaris]|uniref:hypothetical protein n=1 Tax=Proteus vulgaris TaxID=585 RepID=UPI0021B13EFF|nr:hypothetical protein [Proteus vulgaris]MCT6519219.1 hypothetical protein [Proteus vulgaris]